MEKVEKISVVVPVYNTAPYLDDFFNGMQGQTFLDWKVYFAYDISDDGSEEKLNDFVRSNPNKYEIIYIPKKDGLGAARDYALNTGKIVGDYVIFLDPDDYPDDSFLQRLYDTAIEYNADVTVCGYERFDDESGKVLCVEAVNNPEELITDIANFDLLGYMTLVVWNKLLKREVIDGLRFTNVKRNEDVFWTLRLIPRIRSIKCINESLYHYRVRTSSLNNNIKEKDYNNVIDEFIKLSIEFSSTPEIREKYKNVINTIAFTRFGIGLTYRTSLNDLKNTKKYSMRTRDVLDEFYPGWRKNELLSFSKCKSRGIKGLGIWGCKILYYLGMFQIYVYFYNWFVKTFKYEIKW